GRGCSSAGERTRARRYACAALGVRVRVVLYVAPGFRAALSAEPPIHPRSRRDQSQRRCIRDGPQGRGRFLNAVYMILSQGQFRRRAMRSVPVITTGIILTLIGLAISGGGIWLVALGGSVYYIIASIGILVTGALVMARRRSALWVYAAVLIGTLIWAVGEVGFDWWPLAARGDVIFPLALWLLTPWITRNLDRGPPGATPAFLPLGLGVIGSAVVLVIALSSTYHEID